MFTTHCCRCTSYHSDRIHFPELNLGRANKLNGIQHEINVSKQLHVMTIFMLTLIALCDVMVMARWPDGDDDDDDVDVSAI